jgi:hypothetical protein
MLLGFQTCAASGWSQVPAAVVVDTNYIDYICV